MRKKSIVELETDMLNGQKLQGPETAAEVILVTSLNNRNIHAYLPGELHAGCQGSGGRVSSLHSSSQDMPGSDGARETDRRNQESSCSCLEDDCQLCILLICCTYVNF